MYWLNIQWLLNTQISNVTKTAIKLFIWIIILVLPITDIFRNDMAVNMYTFVKLEEKKILIFWNIFCDISIILLFVFKDRIV